MVTYEFILSKFKTSSWFKDRPLMLQTWYSDNMMLELCWSHRLQKAELASIFYVDKEEQRNEQQQNKES